MSLLLIELDKISLILLIELLFEVAAMVKLVDTLLVLKHHSLNSSGGIPGKKTID
jgi:hypothetical protein